MKNQQRLAGLALVAAFALGQTPANAQSPLDAENQALITQLGDNQRAAIEQRNLEGGLLSGVITQLGDRNTASMLLEGGDLSGDILQHGNDNAAALIIDGRNNSGRIVQDNGGNSGGLQITGEGKDVTLMQHGGVQATDGTPIRIGGDMPGGMDGRTIMIQQY